MAALDAGGVLDAEAAGVVASIKKDVGDDLLERCKLSLLDKDKYVTGKMYRSMEHNVGEGIVGSKRDGIWYVEFGRPPMEVPISDLKEWAEMRFGLDERAAWKVAYRVRDKILAEGTEASRFMLGALEDLVAG